MRSSTRRPRGIGRLTAGLAAVALLVSGTVAASAPAAVAAYPDSFNPFAIAGGFTVYAREDALLQNQETEGSIAAGGTTTVQGSSGTYSIIHVAAGTADYALPTVDGDPTRLLTGRYSEQSTGILQITSAGTSDPALQGDLKLVERDGPFQPFARADFIRLNTNPSSVDQTPLIDATHQRYPADAAPPAGATGDGSIYTTNTGGSAVADYVEANQQANWADAQSCLADLPTTGFDASVNTSASAPPDRVVLNPLSADQVNVLDYSELPTGTKLIQFSEGPTPGVANPLVVRVPVGTTTVNGFTIDPQGQYSPYVFWDLSALTGPVDVIAPNGGSSRMDGSIYAPNADVTVTAAPLDGQIIGQNVTIKGGEVHSYVFAGTIACGGGVGTFGMAKEIDGDIPLPAGTVFTVNYTAALPDGSRVSDSLELPADGTVAPADVDFPAGTVVTFEEITPPTVPGWTWSAPVITPDRITIGSDVTPTVVVTNAATQEFGSVTVRKLVVDTDGEPVPGADGSVPVSWAASDGQNGTLSVPVDGTVVPVPADFPVGTEVTFTEDLDDPPAPPGYDWVDAGWDPSDTVTVADDSTSALTLTNVVAPEGLTARLLAARKVIGDETERGYAYSLSYHDDVDPTMRTVPLRIGAPTLLPGVSPDATTLTIVENAPTLGGAAVDTDDWETPTLTVLVGGVPTSQALRYGEEATVVIPASGFIGIQVSNAIEEGTFALRKEFASGIDLSDLRADIGFTVGWTATTPTGAVTTGTMRVPANGTAVSPLDAAGDPLQFPYGTTVSYTEQTRPNVPGLTWGEPVSDPDPLVVGDEGATTVTGTVTNSATWNRATFAVRKEIVGIDPSLLPAGYTFTVDYTATPLVGTPTTGSFELPANGDPAGPAESFPVGTFIRLSEPAPDPADLPPGYEWAGTTWTPSSFLLVREGAASREITVTNTVEQFTRYAVTKTVAGNAASDVPVDTVYGAHVWLDAQQVPDVALREGVTFTSRWLPVGTVVEVEEAGPPDLAGIDWGAPVWALSDGTVLERESDGRIVLPAAAMGTQTTVALQLTNQATRPLPATGGTLSPAIPIAGISAILLGLALVARRRARTS